MPAPNPDSNITSVEVQPDRHVIFRLWAPKANSVKLQPEGPEATPGITPEQRKTLSTAVENMVKSDAWKDILKQKGWDDAYLSGDAFADFLKKENARVTDVLKSVGLVKS